MIDKEYLGKAAAGYGIVLTEKMLASLDLYAALLLQWNEKINLTAITEVRLIEEKHFLDSLLLAMQPEVQGNLADVGSGAGFPGLVAKIYKADLQVALFEPTGKRVNFLLEMARQLKIDVDVTKERAEEAARKKWREQYDVVTARAVASLPVLCEYCLPLAKVGGLFIAMKGQGTEELQKARNAMDKLGAEHMKTLSFTLPGGDERQLIFIKKTQETPRQYPRNGGTIAKRPL